MPVDLSQLEDSMNGVGDTNGWDGVVSVEEDEGGVLTFTLAMEVFEEDEDEDSDEPKEEPEIEAQWKATRTGVTVRGQEIYAFEDVHGETPGVVCMALCPAAICGLLAL